MAIDRAATLKKAEALLGEGKLDAAIVEYVRLVEDQPTDWNAGNTLGDLYVRAGDRERAVIQFTQVADSQYRQGFVAKATAFYKKALRVKSGDEHALAQLATIAAQQELLADAKTYLSLLMKQRNDRGDTTGVAECLVRIAALDEDNPDAKCAAAKAGKGLFDEERVARLFVEAAEGFEKQNRNEEARAAFAEAAGLEIRDPELRRRIVHERDAGLEGSAEQQRRLATEDAPTEPVRIGEPISVDPTESIAIPAASQVDPMPSIAEPAATLEVETATGQTLSFPPVSAPEESRPEPQEDSLVDLMMLLDETSEAVPESASAAVDASISDAPETPYVLNVPNDLDVPNDLSVPEELSAPSAMNVANEMQLANDSNGPIVSNVPNVPNAPNVPNDPNAPNVPNVPNDPNARTISADEKVRFEEMLARSVRRTRQPEVQSPTSREPLVGNDGEVDVIAQLETASRTPSLQFQASAQLGRLLIQRGELRKGVEWLERAVQAPIQIPEHGIAVLYEMADALEQMGETARTLEVLLELEANAGSYRDVHERIARLTRPQAGDGGA